MVKPSGGVGRNGQISCTSLRVLAIGQTSCGSGKDWTKSPAEAGEMGQTFCRHEGDWFNLLGEQARLVEFPAGA